MQGRLLKPIEETRGTTAAAVNENVFRDPYDSFMQKHLSYYGYFSGLNDLYRRNYSYDWNKQKKIESDSSSSSSEDEDDAAPPVAYAYQDGRLIPRFRDKDLSMYASPSMPPQEERAKWPIGMESVREKISHIVLNTSRLEPLYVPTGIEAAPPVMAEENGRIVYQYKPIVGLYFARSMEGAREPSEGCAVPLSGPEDTTLIFESRFESGNLQKVVQISEFEYQLYLRYDLYTDKHTQWYYFRVSNTRAGPTYRFTIVNFLKSKSLYQLGMRPLIYSEREASQRSNGWHRTGSEIKYYKNNMKYKTQNGNKEDRYFYSLTFTFQFQHSRDTCYFAHCFPYTYTMLQEYLLRLSRDPEKSKICKQRELCRTLAGNVVYCITITSHCQNPRENDFKKAVVLTARVHPGESNASWIMQGFLDFLTGDDLDAKLLREAFIFKLVPMLNPDGVIVGNYRCSLAGRDLNRNYKTALRDSYPSVFYTKELITRLIADNRNVVAYFDLHGHSRRQNVFMYGCENRHDPALFLKERILIYMLSLTSPDKVHYPSCKFKIQKYKEGTGRIVMWANGLINSFTMEASMCGTTLVCPPRHFNSQDYQEIAMQFCDALLDYCDPDPTKYIEAFGEVERRVRGQLLVALGRSRQEQINTAGGNKPSTSSSSLSDVFGSSLNFGASGSGGDILSDLLADASLLDDTGDSSDDDSDSSLSDGPPVNSRFIPTKRADSDSKKRKKKSKSDMKRKTQTRARAESEPAPPPEPPPPSEPPATSRSRKNRPIAASTSTAATATSSPKQTPQFVALKISREVTTPGQVKLKFQDESPPKDETSDVARTPKEHQPSMVRFDSRTGAGFPIFTEERSVERLMKKGAICYLEAVTDELLKKRMLMGRHARLRMPTPVSIADATSLPPPAEVSQDVIPQQGDTQPTSKGMRPSTISIPMDGQNFFDTKAPKSSFLPSIHETYLSWHARSLTERAGTAAVQRPGTTGIPPTVRNDLTPPVVIGNGITPASSALASNSINLNNIYTTASAAKLSTSAITAAAIMNAVTSLQISTENNNNNSEAKLGSPLYNLQTSHLILNNSNNNHNNNNMNSAWNSAQQLVVDTTNTLAPSNVLTSNHLRQQQQQQQRYPSSTARRSSASVLTHAFERSPTALVNDLQQQSPGGGGSLSQENMSKAVENNLIIERMSTNLDSDCSPPSSLHRSKTIGDFAAPTYASEFSAAENANNYSFSASNRRQPDRRPGEHPAARALHQSRYGIFHGSVHASDGGPHSPLQQPHHVAATTLQSVARTTNQYQQPQQYTQPALLTSKPPSGFDYAIVGASALPTNNNVSNNTNNDSNNLYTPYHRRYSNPLK